jgi:pimeloyl-ACP methyl ester carboxylesterase
LLGLADEGYNVFAFDLWGYGYSSKPNYASPEAQAMNGETGRPQNVIKQFELGTSDGKGVRVRDIDLKHPVSSPYNFFTWSEQIVDFTRYVIMGGDNDNNNKSTESETTTSTATRPVTLVCNSIGTSSSLQAVIDQPGLFTGVCVVTPNFRELHSAEIPCPQLTMPIVKQIQKTLREKGQPLFDALAKPTTVKQILKEPYKVTEAIDDTLVQVLLDPLLLEGASNVVFDTLSYSAGPLPEQQLSMFPPNKPVWITYGTDDPWTPGRRVDALINKPCVEKVVPLPGIGHCPHDECPELVNPFILDFLRRVHNNDKVTSSSTGNGARGEDFVPVPSQ